MPKSKCDLISVFVQLIIIIIIIIIVLMKYITLQCFLHVDVYNLSCTRLSEVRWKSKHFVTWKIFYWTDFAA